MAVIDNESNSDKFPYIAFLSAATPAEPKRLEYAFHAFSLSNECCYTPTLDVTFSSANQDVASLEEGVEQLIEAALGIKAEAVVIGVDGLQRKLLANPENSEMEIGKNIFRMPSDVRALITQALETHNQTY